MAVVHCTKLLSASNGLAVPPAAICERKAMSSDWGNITMRSLPPLPLRTTSTRRSKSTSFTRRRNPSLSRMPVLYNSLASNSSTPVIVPNKAATSVTVITDGMRLGRVGRCTSSSQGNFTPRTSRYKKSRALSAWLWVDTDTLRWVVSMVKNCSTSAAPNSRGWRARPPRPCHRTKNFTQYTGRPPGPGRWYAVHFHRPGPGVLTSAPALLER